MFVVTEEDEAAIRAVYEQRGEFAAAIELRRRFPGVTDNPQAHRQLEAAATAAGEADVQDAAVPSSALTRGGQRGSSLFGGAAK
jgi:hypothetical protein